MYHFIHFPCATSIFVIDVFPVSPRSAIEPVCACALSQHMPGAWFSDQKRNARIVVLGKALIPRRPLIVLPTRGKAIFHACLRTVKKKKKNAMSELMPMTPMSRSSHTPGKEEGMPIWIWPRPLRERTEEKKIIKKEAKGKRSPPPCKCPSNASKPGPKIPRKARDPSQSTITYIQWMKGIERARMISGTGRKCSRYLCVLPQKFSRDDSQLPSMSNGRQKEKKEKKIGWD